MHLFICSITHFIFAALATFVAAKFDIFPVALPFFAPRERASTSRTSFLRQVVFIDRDRLVFDDFFHVAFNSLRYELFTCQFKLLSVNALSNFQSTNPNFWRINQHLVPYCKEFLLFNSLNAATFLLCTPKNI